MATKKQKLLKRAKETVRQPKPSRAAQPGREKKGYRVVAVSLYTNQASWIDFIASEIRKGGNSKANRSFVVQEAIMRLQEALDGKSAEQVTADINDSHRRRSAQVEA